MVFDSSTTFFELNSKSHLSEEGCLINGILGILCLVNKSGERCTEQKIYEPQQLKRALCALVACLVIIYNSFLRQNSFLSAHALNSAKPDYNSSSWELKAGLEDLELWL